MSAGGRAAAYGAWLNEQAIANNDFIAWQVCRYCLYWNHPDTSVRAAHDGQRECANCHRLFAVECV